MLTTVQSKNILPDHLIGGTKLWEYTGLWEYLTETERHDFLSTINENMVPGDNSILTALINDPDQEFFKAIGLDNLRPYNLSDMIETSKRIFTCERITINSNKTYATIIAFLQ